MKIKDTALGKWMKTLDSDDERAAYIAQSLVNTRDGVFWEVIERFDLKAKSVLEIGYLVLERLMEFDPDEKAEPCTQCGRYRVGSSCGCDPEYRDDR